MRQYKWDKLIHQLYLGGGSDWEHERGHSGTAEVQQTTLDRKKKKKKKEKKKATRLEYKSKIHMQFSTFV